MFRGIEKCNEIIERGLAEKRPILLIGDPDPDGLFSLKLMCDYFNMRGIKYDYYVNNNRKHGLFLRPEAMSGYLVVMADFSVSRDEVLSLIGSDVYGVVLDHHEIDDDFIEYENFVVINNQYSFEADGNRYLSGAGVVYETFCAINPDYKSNERESIVGITLLSDAREIENKKAKYYLRKTFSSNDEYIKYLVECTNKSDFGFGAPRMDRSFVDFTFSPTVNAMLRFNNTSEAVNFILGGGLSSDKDYHAMQKELVSSIKSEAEVLKLPNVIIIGVNAMKFNVDISNFIGLLCSRYRGMYNKSSLIFSYDNKGCLTRASFRGLYSGVDYRGKFREMGINAEGHRAAFGIPTFAPNKDTWMQINNAIVELEKDQTDTKVVIETANLSATMMSKGVKIAYENCFVRDEYRTYIRYTGKKGRVTHQTFRTVPFTDRDYMQGRTPDSTKDGTNYKFELDGDGNRIVKYLEYLVDGRVVKSFGVSLEDGLIMPIQEKGYIQLYLV